MNTEPNNPKLKLGDSVGRWTLSDFLGKIEGRNYWFCTCACGTKRNIRESSLLSGKTKSCGCLRDEVAKLSNTKHGLRGTTEYSTWMNMRDRCNNPSNKRYEYYGGKGIKVCDRWDDFNLFLLDMGNRPDGLTLERKDSEKNYCPENCVWADIKTQNNNKSNNRLLCVDGLTLNLAQWSERNGVDYNVLYWRVTNGWKPERAVLP